MDINEIKKLIKNSTAVLVLENNEPEFVIMNYQTYKDLVTEETKKEIKISHSTSNGSPVKINQKDGELEILDRINREIMALKDEIEREEKTLYVE